jgi:hypothetical protein
MFTGFITLKRQHVTFGRERNKVAATQRRAFRDDSDEITVEDLNRPSPQRAEAVKVASYLCNQEPILPGRVS